MSDRHQTNAYPLRIPQDLRQWVKQQADENARSFNGQVLFLIMRARAAEQKGAQQ